jgi:broad specificity phosphatase PhoE
VAHDAVNRVVLLAALDGSLDAFFRVGQDNAAVNVLEVEPGGLVVATLNDTSHL